MIQEGVTQYQLIWQKRSFENIETTPDKLTSLMHLIAELTKWRTELFDLGVIGQDANRYGGIGFGNLSGRTHDNKFIISGTQTGPIRILEKQHYCKVNNCIIENNVVEAQGPIAPSSEAMTHFIIYQLIHSAAFVFHIHCPALWHAAPLLNIPITPVEVGYGTPEMALAVSGIVQKRPNLKVIAMGGHVDGLLFWSTNIQSMGNEIARLLNCIR